MIAIRCHCMDASIYDCNTTSLHGWINIWLQYLSLIHISVFHVLSFHDVVLVLPSVQSPFPRPFGLATTGIWAVSYTHLDVYKRQSPHRYPCYRIPAFWPMYFWASFHSREAGMDPPDKQGKLWSMNLGKFGRGIVKNVINDRQASNDQKFPVRFGKQHGCGLAYIPA